MTCKPMAVEKSAPLLEAAKLMQSNDIRHLPVLFDGRIEGVLSATDIQLIRGLRDVDIEKLKVYDCFTPNPFTVTPEALLTDVLDEMAEKKYGCALVADNEHLVGIFTSVDAIRATKFLLESRLK
jgi:acetoin utilization protein AcuB